MRELLSLHLDPSNRAADILQEIPHTYLGTHHLSTSQEIYKEKIQVLISSINLIPGLQNDTEECFIRIMIALEMAHSNNFLIQINPTKLFKSQLTNLLSCTTCKQISRNEITNMLSLRIYPMSPSLKEEAIIEVKLDILLIILSYANIATKDQHNS